MDQVPVEKWADRIRIFDGSPAQAVEVGAADLSVRLPDLFQVRDADKTAGAQTAISETVAAINELRRIFGGFGPLKISEVRVHILDEAECQNKISPGRASVQGRSRFGHVYLRRSLPLADFMAVLAHELLHDISYLWLDCWKPGAVSADGIRWPPFVERRQGMLLIDPSYGTWLPHFHGLNEAVTETAAMLVRGLMVDRTCLLDDTGKQRLKTFVSSQPLVALMDCLLATTAGPGGDAIAVWNTLFRDFLTGTDEFLLLLEKRLPGATEILRATGARPEELLPTAEKHGLTDIVPLIRQFCR